MGRIARELCPSDQTQPCLEVFIRHASRRAVANMRVGQLRGGACTAGRKNRARRRRIAAWISLRFIRIGHLAEEGGGDLGARRVSGKPGSWSHSEAYAPGEDSHRVFFR